jgi:predicted DNA-binding transcriptional regulator AlpA
MPKARTQTPDTKCTDKTEQKRPPHPHPLTIRPQDLADRLGVTRRYVYKLLKCTDASRRLPQPIKVGNATFWRATDIQNWLSRQAENTAT